MCIGLRPALEPAPVARRLGLRAALVLLGWLWLLASPAAQSQPRASEIGTPPLRVWLAADTNMHRQHWRVMPMAGGRVLVAHGRGVGLFDGQRWEVLSTEGRTWVRFMLPATQGWIVATTSRLLHLQADERGRLTWQSWVDLRSRPDVDFGGTYGFAQGPFGHLVLGPQRLVQISADGQVRVLVDQGQIRWLGHVGGRWLAQHEQRGLLVVDEQDPSRLEPLAGGEALIGLRVRDILVDADGSWLVATVPQGILRWRAGRLEPVSADLRHWSQAHPTRQLLRLPDGRLAVGSSSAGLALFDAAGRLLQLIDRSEGLPSNSVGHMALDERGDLWLAMNDGVARVQIGSRITGYGGRHGLEAVNALVRHNARLVLGTDQGLRVLDPGRHDQPLMPVPGLPAQTFALASLHGELFVGMSGGVHRVDGADGPLDRWKPEQLAAAPFVYGLLAERGGAARLFAATVRGLFIIERQAGAWVARGPVAGVPATELQLLAQDDEGALWIGSRDGRAWRVRSGDAAWTQLEPRAFGVADGLPNGGVTPIGDPAGFFLATFHGPMRLGPDGRFHEDPRFAGLPRDRKGDRDWFRFLPTRQGRLWSRIGPLTGIATPRAGAAMDWDETVLRGFAPEVPYSYVEDDDGTVWIGRERSLLRAAPGADETAPGIVPSLRRVLDGRGEVLAADRALAGLHLGAQHDALRLEFAWPSFRDAASARFRSWLEGHEHDYTPWSRETFRDVSGLRGGGYRLHLEVMDRFGHVQRAAPWEFRLAPPAWRSPWALAVYALMALALLAGAAWASGRWRTRRLLARQQQLEDTVRLRTAQLASQAEQLQRLDVERSRFYAGVTHEFRTPLMLILEPLRELIEGHWGRLPRGTGRPLEHIGRNARRVLSLVNQLLDLQSADAGALKLLAREADLAALVRGVGAEFESLARHAGITLTVQADEALPIWIDAARMESVLANLLGNALKFTPAGGHVSVHLRRDDGHAVLTVADTGPGIPPEDRPRLFERFRRGRATAGVPGTGVGLALVKAQVLRHGGQVVLLERDAPGACFEVRLPLGDAHLSAEDKAPPLASPSAAAATAPTTGSADTSTLTDGESGHAEAAAAPDARSASVLVIDDNAELREFLAERLALRFEVLQAGGVEEGWRLIREALPDLVLSDVSMPPGDGVALCRRAKADPETAFIPFVLMASRETVAARVRGFDAGADDFIGKPFHTAELVARLAALLASRRQALAKLVEAARNRQTAPPPDEPPLRSAVRQHLIQHLNDSGFGVAELAAALNVDRTTLFKRLKAAGLPAPTQLLRELRLEAAAALLRDGEASVSTVAYACGFESLSHFSRTFKAQYGSTPSEWARRAHGMRPGE